MRFTALFLTPLLLLPMWIVAEPPEVPGQRADGAVVLPNQWLLRPVGKQISVGDFPVNIALHPGGTFGAVLHSGHGPHEVLILNLGTNEIVSRVRIEEGFYGLAFSANGARLFCSGATAEVLHSFSFSKGYLSDHQMVELRNPKERGVPAGLAASSDGTTVYLANLWSHSITRVKLGPTPIITELPLTGSQKTTSPVIAPTTDDPSITKRAEAAAEPATSADPFPYTCVLDEKRRRLYVSLWAHAEVAVIDTKSLTVTARWKTEEHPNEMLLSRDGSRLFVANANRNSVSVLDTKDGHTIELLIAVLNPTEAGTADPQVADAPSGNTPNSLALSPDEKRLYVANANINTVAVFDVDEPGKARSLGFIPVGWYPTSVRVTRDGRTLVIANGKGGISRANPQGPVPGRPRMQGVTQYIGDILQGTVSLIPLKSGEAAQKQLLDWTARAYSCLPETARKMRAESAAQVGPIPRKPGDPTPIKYVIYIIKENRTYDQVLGDMVEGNGSASLCLFPERVTPNHHALAREFVLLDNFYVESEVSADGHEWTMGAYATDFVEKMWPLSYGHNARKKLSYPSEGNFDIATPAGGYLWDRAKQAGVSYRSYGEWVKNGKTPDDPAVAKVPALVGHIDPGYRSFDTDYLDVKRAARFISELHRFEAEGEMPRLQMVRLPNDHTSGASPGKLTPTAQVGDNDLAFGQIIEALSKSKFWPETAVFVVEDDAQNGPDHVDAHRTIAFVISPYVKRGSVDSTLYSTSSMLRTMELILGLRPMSQFDAAAMPMFRCFQPAADLRPYTAKPVIVDLTERNTASSWGAKRSRTMDFTREDAADDLLLNEMIWRSVRGPKSPMPAPTRAAFVFTRAGEKDDD